MKELNKITSYLMGVCENNNVPYTHKMLGGCFNCFYIDFNQITFGVIEHVKDLSNMFNYHLHTEINTDFAEINGKIETTKTIVFAYFE